MSWSVGSTDAVMQPCVRSIATERTNAYHMLSEADKARLSGQEPPKRTRTAHKTVHHSTALTRLYLRLCSVADDTGQWSFVVRGAMAGGKVGCRTGAGWRGSNSGCVPSRVCELVSFRC